MTSPSSTAPTAPPWRIRPMRWWHIPQVAELESVLFPGDSPWSEAMFWSELAAGNHYVVAGAVTAQLSDQELPDEDVIQGYAGVAVGIDDADIQTVGVDPAAQRRGIGRALFADLLAAAGGRTVHLEVRTDNAAAIALYESEGFQRVGLRRHYYQPSGADAYTMLRPAADTGY